MSEKTVHTDTQMFRVVVDSTVSCILERKDNARRLFIDIPLEAPEVFISPNRSSLTTLNGRLVHPTQGLQDFILGPDEDLFAITTGINGVPVHMTVEDQVEEGHNTDGVDEPQEATSDGERAKDKKTPSGRPSPTPSARGM